MEMSKRNAASLLAIALLLLALSVSIGCTSIPKTIEEDIPANTLFRLAQEAYGVNRYELATLYYDTIINRYYDTKSTRVAAQYELAFLYYKQNNITLAKELLEELLAEYQRDSTNFPRWVAVLSNLVYEKINS